jgi:hypothetical protein
MPVMIDCPNCKEKFQSTLIQSKKEGMFRTNPIIGGDMEEICPKCKTSFKPGASALYWTD